MSNGTSLPGYVGQAGVARYLGVTRGAVANWMRRFPEEIPEPDAIVDARYPMWLTERLPEWGRWYRQGVS